MRRLVLAGFVVAASTVFLFACALSKDGIRPRPGDFAFLEFELRG